MRRSGRAVVVVGATGGVGASTLAALLAARWARSGQAVTLVDLDTRAGGIEVLLGAESAGGARWPDLAGLRAPVSAADLDRALPRWGSVEVLGGDRRAEPLDPAAVHAVWDGLVDAGRTVVADLPARLLGSDDLAALTAHAQVVVLTGQDVLGVAAAAVAAPTLPATTHLVLRRRRGARVAPAQVAATLRLPLLGLLPTDRRVADAVDRGLGPVVAARSRLGRAVAGVARGLDRELGRA